MTSINRLPDEVLVNIARQLRRGSGTEDIVPLLAQGDLERLCRVSKRFNRIAQPELYRNVAVRLPRIGLALTPEANWLLAKLCETPNCGMFVRRLAFQPYRSRNRDLRDALEKTRGWLEELYDADFMEWLERFVATRPTDECTEVVLLLALMPNVETLKLGICDDDGVAMLFEYCRNALTLALEGERLATAHQVPDPCIPLRNLRRLELHHVFVRHNVRNNLGILAPLAFYPRLQSVSLRGVVYDTDRAHNLDLPPGRRYNVKEVRLCLSPFDAGGLRDILTRFQFLDTLRFTRVLPNSANLVPNYSDIGDVLRRHGKNLQRLEITRGDLMFSPQGYTTGTIGSLQELSQLKMLGVFPGILVGRSGSRLALNQTLPSSLVWLMLHSLSENEPDYVFTQDVYDILDAPEDFPCLCWVYLGWSLDYRSMIDARVDMKLWKMGWARRYVGPGETGIVLVRHSLEKHLQPLSGWEDLFDFRQEQYRNEEEQAVDTDTPYVADDEAGQVSPEEET